MQIMYHDRITRRPHSQRQYAGTHTHTHTDERAQSVCVCGRGRVVASPGMCIAMCVFGCIRVGVCECVCSVYDVQYTERDTGLASASASALASARRTWKLSFHDKTFNGCYCISRFYTAFNWLVQTRFVTRNGINIPRHTENVWHANVLIRYAASYIFQLFAAYYRTRTMRIRTHGRREHKVGIIQAKNL